MLLFTIVTIIILIIVVDTILVNMIKKSFRLLILITNGRWSCHLATIVIIVVVNRRTATTS